MGRFLRFFKEASNFWTPKLKINGTLIVILIRQRINKMCNSLIGSLCKSLSLIADMFKSIFWKRLKCNVINFIPIFYVLQWLTL